MTSFAITQIIALVSLFVGVFGIILTATRNQLSPFYDIIKAVAIMAMLMAVVSGFILLVRSIPPTPTCIAMAGSKVRWVNSYDSSRYVYVDLGNKTYCRIYDNRLYYLGVDAILDQNYEGIPESRP
jgi:hypothetical protein